LNPITAPLEKVPESLAHLSLYGWVQLSFAAKSIGCLLDVASVTSYVRGEVSSRCVFVIGAIRIRKPERATDCFVWMFLAGPRAFEGEQNLGAGLDIVKKPLIVQSLRGVIGIRTHRDRNVNPLFTGASTR